MSASDPGSDAVQWAEARRWFSKADEDLRVATFANGMVVREHILDIDDHRRRLAYTVLDGPGMTFHHASMQIVATGSGRSEFVWITDLLPAEARDAVVPLVEAGSRALKTNLEAK